MSCDAEEQPSWRKEQTFHERSIDKEKGPLGMDLDDFIDSHANKDPSASQRLLPDRVTGGQSGLRPWFTSRSCATGVIVLEIKIAI